MRNETVLRIALEQSATDLGCTPEDFMKSGNVLVPFRLGGDARKYYKEPIGCTLVSYGSNIVAATGSEITDLVETYLGRYPFEHCFETPNLHWFDEKLKERGWRVCFMAEYFLPDVERLREPFCPYDLRELEKEDLADLYRPEWSNALCADRKELDECAVGAFDGDRLVGLAGCSEDCARMRQIGVDVLPEYRRRGIASALTGCLAKRILDGDNVPFYCSAWSNLRSVRNALRCGFYPAWVELTVKPAAFTDALNGSNGEPCRVC